MTTRKRTDKDKQVGGGFEGMLTGLTELFDRLRDLAETGAELSRTGEVQLGDKGQELKGIFGLSLKLGLGGEEVKVEPFGNIGKDKETGRSVVQEIREPLVDVFEEKDHILIVAEMPGVQVGDVQLDLHDDILTLSAKGGDKSYRKEILLPEGFDKDKISVSSKHGIVEIKCMKLQ